MIKTVCCIGAGYVGGPTMAVFADKCTDIIFNVVDVNEDRIAAWNDNDLSKLPIFEPGLDQIIERRRGRNLIFSTEVHKHISEADMIFISVNTPTKTKGIGAGQASDLKWVESCAREISNHGRGHTIVVEKSTLPVRTGEVIKDILDSSQSCNKENKKTTFDILSNPEFLAEGSAISDLEDPDRILIGGSNKKAINALHNLYKRWVSEDKIIHTNLWSSELSKLSANAFLAQRVSSINSISALCEATGADIGEVARAIGKDSRIGVKFLNSGPGFGGSCFKKDIMNLIYICNHYGLSEVSKYWEKVIEINSWQTKRISKLVVDKLFGTLSNKKIGILGFSYKSNTNDTRESPAIRICNDLLDEGAILQIYDPKVSKEQITKDLINENLTKGSWNFFNSIEEASFGSDALLILTEWEEFSEINWELIANKMRSPSWVFDTRLISNVSESIKYGIKLWTVGKGEII